MRIAQGTLALEGGDASNYRLSYANARLLVVQSATAVDAGTFDGEGESAEFVYGDTVTVSGKASIAGVPAAEGGSPAAGSLPAAGKVSLVSGDKVLAGPADVDDTGAFSLSYDTSLKGLSAGGDPGLTLRFESAAQKSYASRDVALAMTLKKRPLAVELSGSATKTYDGTNAYDESESNTLSVSLSGALPSDEAMPLITGEPNIAWASKDAGTRQVEVSGVTLTDEAAPWYEAPSSERLDIPGGEGILRAAASVSAADPRLSFGDSAPDSYELDVAGAQGALLESEGLGDTLKEALNVQSTYTSSLSAGSEYTVTLEWAEGTAPEAFSNYEIELVSKTFTVEAAGPSEVVFAVDNLDALSKTYDAAPLETPTISASTASGDTLDGEISYVYQQKTDSGSWVDVEGVPVDAGTYRIAVREVAASGNYLGWQGEWQSGEITIASRPLRVGAAALDDVVYGSDMPDLSGHAIEVREGSWADGEQESLASLLSDSVAFTSTYAKGDPVGSYALTVSWASGAAPEELSNYAVQFVDRSFEVVRADIDRVEIVGVADSATYSGAPIAAPTVKATDANGYESDGKAVLSFFRKDASDTWQPLDGQALPKDVGVYRLEVAVEQGTNHNACTQTAEKEFEIRPATLTIKANNLTVVYGEELSDVSGEYSVEGLVGGETLSSEGFEGALSVSVPSYVAGTTEAGSYPDAVQISGLSNPNYSITYVAGDLEVVRAGTALEVKTYLGAEEQDAFTYGDVVTVKGFVKTTGAAARAVPSVRRTGEVALYHNDAQISEPVKVGDDGSFELSYDTADKAVPAGSEETIAVRYAGGASTQASAEAELAVRIERADVSLAVSGIDGLVYGDAVSLETLATDVRGGSSDGKVSYRFFEVGEDGSETELNSTPAHAGNYVCEVSVEADDFHNAASDRVPFAIAKRTLSVEPDPVEIAYGNPLPESWEIAIEGWQGGDKDLYEQSLRDALVVACDYKQGMDAGTYSITASVGQGAEPAFLSDYALDVQPANLVVVRSLSAVEAVPEQTDYTYGETVTISGTVSALGVADTGASSQVEEGEVSGDGSDAPAVYSGSDESHTVSLYWEDTELASAPVGEDGSYEITYGTAQRLLPALGEDAPLSLEVRYAGDGKNLGASEKTVELTLGKAPLTPVIEGSASKPYDGTALYQGDGARVVLEGAVPGDADLLAGYTLSFGSADAGAQRLFATGIALTEDADAWYLLVTDAAESENAQGGIS